MSTDTNANASAPEPEQQLAPTQEEAHRQAEAQEEVVVLDFSDEASGEGQATGANEVDQSASHVKGRTPGAKVTLVSLLAFTLASLGILAVEIWDDNVMLQLIGLGVLLVSGAGMMAGQVLLASEAGAPLHEPAETEAEASAGPVAAAPAPAPAH